VRRLKLVRSQPTACGFAIPAYGYVEKPCVCTPKLKTCRLPPPFRFCPLQYDSYDKYDKYSSYDKYGKYDDKYGYDKYGKKVRA
jgi:hypothetical protein